MPYISQEDRDKIEEIAPGAIDKLSEALQGFPIVSRKGRCNYIISMITLLGMKPTAHWSYHSISNAVSVLRDAATELERRLMAVREDEAIAENGDLIPYQTSVQTNKLVPMKQFTNEPKLCWP